MHPPPRPKIWSFDIGVASLGLAIRGYETDPNDFSLVESLRIPEEFAATKPAASRRRMWRTRLAHKAREQWLRQIFEEAGLEVLQGRQLIPKANSRPGEPSCDVIPGDPRLEREFPEPGDNTAYCGAALRILLVQGQHLEPWQVFKAFHSAIQKRGYDPNVPWKNSRAQSSENDENQITLQRAMAMQGEIEATSPDEVHHLPCYWEASRMGLWTPDRPDEVRLRIDHTAMSTRFGSQEDPSSESRGRPVPAVFPRRLVEEELRQLVAAAEKQYPQLTGKASLIIYGPAGESYASYKATRYGNETRQRLESSTGDRLVEGKASDWKGVLAQKIPTFENRCPNNCGLIPRLNVCRSAPRISGEGIPYAESMLSAEVTCLMKLKNLRFHDTVIGDQRGLSADELANAFQALREKADIDALKHDDVRKAGESAVRALQFTRAGLRKWLATVDCEPSKNHELVAPPKPSGRSRFSRPALRIIRGLLFSGQSPAEFHPIAETRYVGTNDDPTRGIVSSDLAFLTGGGMGDDWDGIYLPNEALGQFRNAAVKGDTDTRHAAVHQLIASQKDPIVRHRLDHFYRKVCALRNGTETHPPFGEPDFVALEFVREDFMGDKAKLELQKFQNQRKKDRKTAREKSGGDNKLALKWQLWKDQNSTCLYCNKNIGRTELEASTEVEHIVPGSQGGPGAYYNLMLSCAICNAAKGMNTPYDWWHGARSESTPRGWDSYVESIHSQRSALRNKKVRILTEPDAADQVERYHMLAETAWISKLAQTVLCLTFGWPLDFAGEERRIRVIPGALTNRVARKYGLYKLLGSEDTIANLVEEVRQGKKDERQLDNKVREDKRHHALDAMVLSFIPSWAVNKGKRVYLKLPEGVHQGWFKKHLDAVVPTWVAHERPTLEETIYGRREDKTTIRREFRSIAYTGQTPKFSPSTLKKNIAKIVSPEIRDATLEFYSAEREPNELTWKAWAEGLILKNGSRVRRVLMTGDAIHECADLSKDGTGAWRKGSRHKGYFLLKAPSGRVSVKPVYAHQSVREIQSLLGSSDDILYGYFQSGDAVSLSSEVNQGSTMIPRGEYLLNSIWSDGRAAISSANGDQWRAINIQRLVEASLMKIS